MHIIYFHRNRSAGYSIDKVTQTIIRGINNKEEYYVPNTGSSIWTILKNIVFVFQNRQKCYVNHVTGDIQYCMFALMGCKSVLTCHDTVSLDYRKIPYFKRLLFEWVWYRFPLKIAKKVVAISESTKICLQQYTSRQDIVVIHNAIDPLFAYTPMPHNKTKVVLIIGTSENKNLCRTFEALKGLLCKVVVIGKLSTLQKEALKINNILYENKIGLTDKEIYNEYVNCDIVSFVSLFEGFGMIVIEANKVGRPVICSDIPVLREVAGTSALFVNPYSVKEIRKGFVKLMTEERYVNDLIKNGQNNVERFDPEIIRKHWINLYNSL